MNEKLMQLITGRSLKDIEAKIPTAEQVIRRRLAMTKTKHPLRKISNDVFFSEEQRPHIHIIGSTRQGKSRFIEWLMREDIDRGLGCCLLDPTAGGETAYRMLAYCAEKKIEKVLFIDPAHTFHPYKKVIGLQPFRYAKDGNYSPKLKHISGTTLMNAVRSLYSVKDPSEQSRVERYLPLVFDALYDSKRPLVDAKYLSNRMYKEQQDEILSTTDEETRVDLEEVLSGPLPLYNNYQSTVNRLIRFRRGLLNKMFSVSKGVNWMRVVRDHWVVIVNLDSLDFFDARLLGTYIIAELETAKKRLNQILDNQKDLDQRGVYPPYYLYADEAYLFASQSLKNMLDLKQKMNFKLTLAHHTGAQFDDPAVYHSIKTNSDITVQFYVRGRADRDDLAKEMYGGDIDPADASYANTSLAKQQAVIKIGKDNPIRERIPDVPAPNVAKEELESYLLKLYQNEWYHDSDQLKQPTNERPINKPAVQPKPSKGTRVSKRNPPPNNQAVNETVKGKSAFSRAKPTGD
jgi:hypothetical protein